MLIPWFIVNLHVTKIASTVDNQSVLSIKTKAGYFLKKTINPFRFIYSGYSASMAGLHVYEPVHLISNNVVCATSKALNPHSTGRRFRYDSKFWPKLHES